MIAHSPKAKKMKTLIYQQSFTSANLYRRFKKFTCMLAILLLTGITNPLNTYAQGNPGDPGCDPLDPACPIDGGLSLLIAAGIGIGARKAYKAKRSTTKI